MDPHPATPDTRDARRDDVRAEIDIAAPPEEVFEALTDPDALAEWWGGDDDGYRTRDWEVQPWPGGRWSARTIAPDGEEGTIEGEYLTIDRPHLLEHSWRASWDDGVTTVRYTLEPVEVGGLPGTHLTVTHGTARARWTARLARVAACLTSPMIRA